MGCFDPQSRRWWFRNRNTPTGQVLICFTSTGIFYTAAILGPAVGYLLGGYFLNLYTELHVT